MSLTKTFKKHLINWKLRANGILGKLLNCIKNWLLDWRQLAINDECFECTKVLSGVPQGSVLGPILFTIYVNNINGNLLSNISKLADDTKLGNRVNCEKFYIKYYKVIWIRLWICQKRQMKFSYYKCKVIHFRSKNKEYDCLIDSVIKVVNEVEDLEVLINKNLKFVKCAEFVKKS